MFLMGCSVKPVVIDFNHLKRPGSPNYYLACPKDACNIKPDIESPCFDVSAIQLQEAWQKVIDNVVRYTELSRNVDENQIQYVQRSLIMRFPDYVTVHFMPLAEGASTLAILSYSKYGHSDFGVNKKRVDSLLSSLKGDLPLCQK